MTHRNCVQLSRMSRAIWKRFARAVWNATRICAINPPAPSPRSSNAGWKGDQSQPGQFHRRRGCTAGCLFFGTAGVPRQVQNWKLGNKLPGKEQTKNSIAVLTFLALASATEEASWTETGR